MTFANSYLPKHALFPPQINEPPEENLGIVVALPCHNETQLIRSLESLWSCQRPECAVEIIVTVNASENCSPEITEQNIRTIEESSEWISNHQEQKFRFHVIYQPDLPRKNAGVGLARKIGMDEAIYRFNKIDNPDGIIACFDADAICDSDYLCEIEKNFSTHPESTAASIYFEHPIEGNEFEKIYYEGIAQYELHLRYFLWAQRYCSFPFAFHTVGSSMAIKAHIYCKQGGMNQKQAGEDFYLLQKIIPLGNFIEINTTRVIPSPRVSDRVPFGTGASMQKFIASGGTPLTTYHSDAFEALKILFENAEKLWDKNDKYNPGIIDSLPEPLHAFLIQNQIHKVLEECNRYSTTQRTFNQRFYRWFNAFRVIRFVNFAHQNYFCQVPVAEAAYELGLRMGLKIHTKDVKDLLLIYRKLDRGFSI